MAVKTVKTVKPVTAERKNGRPAAKRKRAKTESELAFEARLLAIENNPDAPLMAKELAPLLRARMESDEPYLTIEQIWAELGRGDNGDSHLP